MVTPLSKQTPARPLRSAPGRYSAVWDSTDGRIADARHAVRTLLAQAGHHPDHRPSQDAQLVVSELVTNAVRHAPGPGSLLLEVTPDGSRLRIAVRDSSPEPPRLQPADPQRVGGHGFRLVGRLCEQLHIIVLGAGKQVVAHLRLGEPGT
ncbi:ATP-binding protein [Streptomyces sp. NPDC088387]|uniref:ATP-binding protein n=1 Tax=Streptomyces sp. NPDC088387 TaxID=3365859 RepID=UPI0037FA2C40